MPFTASCCYTRHDERKHGDVDFENLRQCTNVAYEYSRLSSLSAGWFFARETSAIHGQKFHTDIFFVVAGASERRLYSQASTNKETAMFATDPKSKGRKRKICIYCRSRLELETKIHYGT